MCTKQNTKSVFFSLCKFQFHCDNILLPIAVLSMQLHACTKIFWLIYVFFCNFCAIFDGNGATHAGCTWCSGRFLEYAVYVMCSLKKMEMLPFNGLRR